MGAVLLSKGAVLLSMGAVLLSMGAVLFFNLNCIGGVGIRQIRTAWRFPSFMSTQIEHPCCNVGTMFTFVHDYQCNLHNKPFF